jgi:general secretion pathway protein C
MMKSPLRLCVLVIAIAGSVPLLATASPSPEAAAEPPAGPIEKVGANAYEIDGKALRMALDAGPAALSRSARFVPEIRGGKARGFRIYSVRRAGALARLGVQNGDVLLTINNHLLDTPEHALAAYAQLRSARRLSVTIEREGRRITNEYRIR